MPYTPVGFFLIIKEKKESVDKHGLKILKN